jgi:membrane-bound serine protease (ClpP class)
MSTLGRARMILPMAGCLACVGCVLLWAPARGQDSAGSPGVPPPRVAVIQIDDAIQPATADYVTRSLAWAARHGVAAVVIEMDTPGGLDTSMRKIIKAMLASPVPVITYVSPAGSRAASAGVFILLASQVAAMTPGTNLGAAHPVAIGGGLVGGQQADSTMISKVTNDAVAYARSLAEQRGRNADWAERAVRESASVPAGEALDLGVIDLLAGNLSELLGVVDGREVTTAAGTLRLRTAGAVLIERGPDLRDQILSVIANPNIAYLLLLLGGLGLFFELSHPGTLFPGIVGALCLFLAFFALQLLPVRAAGVALIALAIVLFLLEIKVTSYGALTMGAVASLFFGSLMLFDTGATGVRVAWSVLLPSVIVVASLFILAVWLAVRAQRGRTVTGREGLVGEVGEARSDLAPDGTVFVHGEIWRAASTAPVSKGQPVRVVSVEGLRLRVEPAGEARRS